ncbi:hypothetical protein ABZW03_40245, partial [Kitasatospora sp. NPDC004799]|uniref:hypothetical protein n=1 Tax=Kitasatospora sp. NPDC004799 TaxID=3154460 RepID=UPI0033B2925A
MDVFGYPADCACGRNNLLDQHICRQGRSPPHRLRAPPGRPRLRGLGLNDPSADEAFDRFAHLAASITRAPIA